jgi:hypothetical protein
VLILPMHALYLAHHTLLDFVVLYIYILKVLIMKLFFSPFSLFLFRRFRHSQYRYLVLKNTLRDKVAWPLQNMQWVKLKEM